jgi:ribosomal protein S10
MKNLQKNTKFRIESYDPHTLEAITQFMHLYFDGKAQTKITRLPTKKTTITHNRSPPVYKLSQESFAFQEHRWLVELVPVKRDVTWSQDVDQFLLEFAYIQSFLGEGSQIELVGSSS